MNEPHADQYVIAYRIRGWAFWYGSLAIAIFAVLTGWVTVTTSDLLGVGVYGSFFVASLWLGYHWISSRLFQGKENGRAIIFQKDSVVVPKSLVSRRRVSVPYRAINSVTIEKVPRAGLRFVNLQYDGKTISISDLGFETADAFEQVYAHLKEKVITQAATASLP